MRKSVIVQLAMVVLLHFAGNSYISATELYPGPVNATSPENQSPGDNTYKNYFITDSAYVYRWSTSISDWELYQVQYYSYTSGRLTELLTRNHLTGVNAALSVYSYNSSGRNESSTNYSWAGTWVPSTRYLNEYDTQGRLVTLRLQKWVNGEWTEERLQQNYQYDVYDRVIGYETIYWRSNAWTLPTVSELSYNALGKLDYHLATRPGGNIDYRIVYEYDESGLMTQFYTQYPSGGGWSNWNLRSFQYDPCGGRRSQLQYTGEGPNWIPSTRTEFYSSFSFHLYPGKKVPVCHNGHTIWVAAEAVPAHLRHGDCIGECTREREKPLDMPRNPPFVVWPNPAKERVTVEFSPDYECGNARIELADFSGKTINSYTVGDNSTITFERGRLKDGLYFIRLINTEVYSVTVLFK